MRSAFLYTVANYQPISITPVLTKVFERFISVRLSRFMERRGVAKGVLPTSQFAYKKGLETCDALLCVCHTLQSALKSGQEARIVKTDFSAAFQGIIFKLCSVRNEGSVLFVLA